MEIKTFKKDTVIMFDRTDFNLKGYRYFIYETPNYQRFLLSIYWKDLPRLKEDLGNRLYDWAMDGSLSLIFSEEDFIDAETYNPFMGVK